MPWYVVQTQPGFERQVSDMIRIRRLHEPVFALISTISIPQSRHTTVTHGHREEVEEKLLPGYILLEMPLIEEGAYEARNTMNAVLELSGVMGFLGAEEFPQPLDGPDAAQILRQHELEEARTAHVIGESVRIITGPFAGHEGVITGLDKRAVHISLAGGFPVEIDGAHVEAA